ncbi:hypothetical protein BC937DRAFT_89170 [Endogone sp. FLAS-F59071]|nr:hypothetical protein BC937DRAFT_89170 [Endogone sp. FLAS-F59071]|eukprot:RUS18072.1 hypothetical protein BC937DRAFT_89170 [Endogone sp. FLAS-F59071]
MPAICNKISIVSGPYAKPFSSVSLSQKSIITSSLYETINNLSDIFLFSKNQSTEKSFNNAIDLTTNSSCIIVLDFKQNFKISSSPVETN